MCYTVSHTACTERWFRQNNEMEMWVEDIKEKTKEAEDLTGQQTTQEDKYDERVKLRFWILQYDSYCNNIFRILEYDSRLLNLKKEIIRRIKRRRCSSWIRRKNCW